MSEEQGKVLGFRFKTSFPYPLNIKSWGLSPDVEWFCRCGETGKGIESHIKHFEKKTHPLYFEQEYECKFIKTEEEKPNHEQC